MVSNLTLQAQSWILGGNTLSGDGRLGTNNFHPLVFETNNRERGRLTKGGLWGFGTNAPTARVHIKSIAGQDALNVQIDSDVRFRVHAGGGVAIGTPTIIPSANGLFVSGSTGIGSVPGAYKMKITHSTFGLDIENAATLDDWEFWSSADGLALYANGSFRGIFNPTNGVYASASDRRFKTEIQPMPSVLEKVNQLKPSTYHFHEKNAAAKASTASYGFVAQEVMDVFPHLVFHQVDATRGLDAYTLDYSGFGVIAIKAIQELQAYITTLENRIVTLEAALEGTGRYPTPTPKGNIGIWLEPNYPNPFRQSTFIGYQAPVQAQHVELLITNLQGRELQRFDHLPAGEGLVELTAGSLPSGIYFYTLKVDGKAVASQKMILER
ncbi:tail fiber domain-containing protein [Catalinimonas alkaloidigena]|nr:tail fiber domain-containing protein [Catalinimonas alkaloidigena]